MKKRMLKILTLACMATAIIGVVTACSKKTTDNPPSSEATSESSENTSTETEAETETETEIAANTENTETETETENTAETSESSDSEEDSSDLPAQGDDIYLDLATTLAYIEDIRAGSAGCSLRTEEAVPGFKAFVETYGSDHSSDEIAELTKEWLNLMKENNPIIEDDMIENMMELTGHIEADSSDFQNSEAYKTVLEGINSALGQ